MASPKWTSAYCKKAGINFDGKLLTSGLKTQKTTIDINKCFLNWFA